MILRTLLLILSVALFTACAEEDKSAQRELQQQNLIEKESQWQDFKSQNQNNYKMTYRNRGTMDDVVSVYSLEVQSNELVTSSVGLERMTMDQMYADALSSFDNPNCALGIHFFPNSPVIRSYTIKCSEESKGAEILSFEGLETFQTEPFSNTFAF